MFLQNSKVKINTPDGFKPFSGIQILKKNGQFTIHLCNGKFIKCSTTHRLMTAGGWKKAIDISHSDIIIGKNFRSKVFFIDVKDGEFEYFDVVGVEDSQFYANDIVSHNCEFLGSSSTLIAGAKLRTLVYQTPVKSDEHLKIFKYPEKDRIYTIAVDTARGREGDYSAFKVFDVTEFPYVDVASYRNKEIDPLVYPSVVYNLANYYNKALILVEINDVGQQVADILQHDLEYDNLIFSYSSPLKGAVVSAGFSGSSHAGVRTTKLTKKIGCSNLKSMIESDKLIINDFDTIQELYRFVSNGTSFEAEEGNDDLVMCCVIFAWLTDQQYFKDYANNNFRRNLYENSIQRIEDELLPFGVIDDKQPIQVGDFGKIQIENLDESRISFNKWMMT